MLCPISKSSVSKMEHVDWDDLRILVEIARGGTMRAAAAACDLSAPTLSRRLTELERRLGEPLIDRVPSGCTVTAFGARVLAWAEQMEDLAHQIERAADVTGSIAEIFRQTGAGAQSLAMVRQLDRASAKPPFRYLMREHRAEIEFIGNLLQPLVACPESGAGL
jgi:DNA-binding transcriptional LysR family regulator